MGFKGETKSKFLIEKFLRRNSQNNLPRRWGVNLLKLDCVGAIVNFFVNKKGYAISYVTNSTH